MIRESYDWPQAERAAREALELHADTAALAQARLTPIEGSLSNFAWHAVTGTQENFVRLARPGSERLGASLEAEAEILHRVATAGLAPIVVRCDPGARLLVTRWIDARLDAPDFTASPALEQVGATMARLHALRVPAHLRHVRFGEQARLLEAALPASAQRTDFAVVATDVFARLDTERRLALCHHDLHAQNILIDAERRLWLVDWEYAGRGSPIFDLASFTCQADLSPVATRTLCSAYVQAGGAVEQDRLALACWAFDYVQWLWYQGLRATAGDGQGPAEAARRSERIELRLLERASAVLRCNNC
jgi:Ser/Thr protein kinase RdoA (MazF antagonist)